MIITGYRTDKGRQRSHNEDACLVLEKEQVYIVADGVGGNKAGELASSTVVNETADFVRSHDIGNVDDPQILGSLFTECVNRANESVLRLGNKYPEYSGMASTLVMCHIIGRHAFFVNVGDSRAYIRRGSELFQVTEDHSYVNTLVKMGVITRDEARDHKKGNVITKAMGAEEDIKADFYQTDIEDQDVILLCTDGLYGEVREENINAGITEFRDMDVLAEELVKKANDAGGKDNITVVCIKVDLKGDNNE